MIIKFDTSFLSNVIEADFSTALVLSVFTIYVFNWSFQLIKKSNIEETKISLLLIPAPPSEHEMRLAAEAKQASSSKMEDDDDDEAEAEAAEPGNGVGDPTSPVSEEEKTTKCIKVKKKNCVVS